MNPSDFLGDPENPFTELSDLRLRVTADRFASRFSVNASLKVDVMSYEHRGIQYDIGVSAAYLGLVLSGLRSIEGTIFGEQRIADISSKDDEERVARSKTDAGVGLSASSNSAPVASGSLAVSAGSEKSHKQSQTKSQVLLAVRALPNDRWKIGFGGVGNAIAGSALIDDELCHLSSANANQGRVVEAQLLVHKIDIAVTATGGNKTMRGFRSFVNKEAILGVIAANALMRHSSKNNMKADEKTIMISRHTLESLE
jgi:hypothetical protein